jgi:hypothetical protein
MNDTARPITDPTTLTTQALEREIMALREILETRMNGQDALIRLMQDTLRSRRTDIDESVTHLRVLHEEKFESIQTQFRERDTRSEQTQKDSKVAVDAALQAAKEAVGEQNKSSALAIAKSEAGTTKQIDQIGVLITTTNAAMNDKIDDLKQRQTSAESRSIGTRDVKEDHRAAVALSISALMAVVGVAAFFYHNSSPTAPTPQVIYVPATTPSVPAVPK